MQPGTALSHCHGVGESGPCTAYYAGENRGHWGVTSPAAAVNINDRAHQLSDHCAALNVPAWSARAPWAVPCGLIWLGGLPEHKVCRMPLACIHCYPLAGFVVLLRVHGCITLAIESWPVILTYGPHSSFTHVYTIEAGSLTRERPERRPYPLTLSTENHTLPSVS